MWFQPAFQVWGSAVTWLELVAVVLSLAGHAHVNDLRPFGPADEIGLFADFGAAFGVREHLHVRVLLAHQLNIVHAEKLVDRKSTRLNSSHRT